MLLIQHFSSREYKQTYTPQMRYRMDTFHGTSLRTISGLLHRYPVYMFTMTITRFKKKISQYWRKVGHWYSKNLIWKR